MVMMGMKRPPPPVPPALEIAAARKDRIPASRNRGLSLKSPPRNNTCARDCHGWVVVCTVWLEMRIWEMGFAWETLEKMMMRMKRNLRSSFWFIFMVALSATTTVSLYIL